LFNISDKKYSDEPGGWLLESGAVLQGPFRFTIQNRCQVVQGFAALTVALKLQFLSDMTPCTDVSSYLAASIVLLQLRN
jgi:hypothetical protein